ncbi:hypothetical protein M2S00_06770 [Apilactobacillus sp. TMW 2.2459]|uniref:hypothetical protein n=1 Tax=Apilactobacillus xinyiensis TaxID=2841032 RepID=UPI00200C4CB8|nr:hypothetical protein [Apilactobacillus xinyiensis]MCL0312807.1 hypothetical protein [Apilactobacillus xinyiensis]
MISKLKVSQKDNIVTAKFKCDELLNATNDVVKQTIFNVCLSDIVSAIDVRLQPIDIVTSCEVEFDKQDDDVFVIKITDDHGLIDMGDKAISK